MNALLLFLLVNLAAWGVLAAGGAGEDEVSRAYDGLMAHGFETLRAVYPGMEDGAIAELLRESWTLPLRYEPYTQFREREVEGRYVNVTAEGYRRNGPGTPPWPPLAGRDVFVFGGSTVFGYGLPDGATLPARLQARLRAAGAAAGSVYNFGRAYYNSSQERVLFERLLAENRRPAVAIFVDGLNDTLLWPRYREQPLHTEALRDLVDAAALNTGWGDLPRDGAKIGGGLRGLPVVRLARRLVRRLSGGPEVRRAAFGAAAGDEDDDKLRRDAAQIAAVYARNLRLARAAARVNGVETLFVLQPVPWHRYDLSRHPFRPEPGAAAALQRRFEASYSALRSELGGDLVDCSGVLEDLPRPAYVDSHHYTAEAAERLAGCVADALGGAAASAAAAEP